MADSDWEREKAFWKSRTVDTFDLEYSGRYSGHNDMVKQTPGNAPPGDWIRSEDYRCDIEERDAEVAALTAEISGLKRQRARWAERAVKEKRERDALARRVAELEAFSVMVTTPEERAVLDAMAGATEHELRSEVARYVAHSWRNRVAFYELVRRSAKGGG